jgi:hypothetical protein
MAGDNLHQIGALMHVAAATAAGVLRLHACAKASISQRPPLTAKSPSINDGMA